jgi:hypothetical protein
MAQKHVDNEKEEGEKREGNEENLRHAGVTNAAYDEKARSAAAENEKLHRDPPPLAHVDPVTGQVLSQPLEKSAEANRNTVPGDGGIKDARPNNGQVPPRNPTK